MVKFWKDPSVGLGMKRLFVANVSQLEAYTESAPTVLILLFLILSPSTPAQVKMILTQNMTMFIITLSTSVLSASFGQSRCLKDGVARIMVPGGRLQGFLTGKFLLIFSACGSTLLVKGVSLTLVSALLRDDESNIIKMIMYSATLIIVIIITIDIRNKQSWKIFLQQPSLILLPVFTFFTFAKIKQSCCDERDIRVKISPVLTIFNILSNIIVIIYSCSRLDSESFTIFLSIPTFIATTTTVASLYLHRVCPCCCQCWLSASDENFSVYDPEQPDEVNLVYKSEVVKVKT